MNEPMEPELRSRFAQLRAADAGNAPDFREMCERANDTTAQAEHARRRLTRFAIPVALAAGLVIAAGIARVAARRDAVVQQSLSTWTSPTASLLRTSDFGLSGSRGILTSVLDPAVSTSVFTKGTRR
jgi:hypothetical protein